MFGLVNRGELSGPSENEFEHLTSRLKSLWLVEHDENGSHRLLPVSAIPNLPVTVIPDLDASKITSGIFTVARIPDLDAAKITSGTFNTARIPNLDATKITSGAFDKARQHAQTAYKDEANTFSTSQTITGVVLITGNNGGLALDPRDGSGVQFAYYNPTGDNLALWNGSANCFVISSAGAIFERQRSTALGDWITVAYNSGNFTASGSMTWTVASGDQSYYGYTLIGKTMIVSVQIANSTIGGTPDTQLRVAIPGGFTSGGFALSISSNNDGAGVSFGAAYVGSGSTYISIFRDVNAANWTAVTDNGWVQFTLAFPLT